MLHEWLMATSAQHSSDEPLQSRTMSSEFKGLEGAI
jgi:hypothetical protein